LGANAYVLFPCNGSVIYQGPVSREIVHAGDICVAYHTLTACLILGINPGDVGLLLNVGTTVCLSCIGVG
jgi:hypothetical protein